MVNLDELASEVALLPFILAFLPPQPQPPRFITTPWTLEGQTAHYNSWSKSESDRNPRRFLDILYACALSHTHTAKTCILIKVWYRLLDEERARRLKGETPVPFLTLREGGIPAALQTLREEEIPVPFRTLPVETKAMNIKVRTLTGKEIELDIEPEYKVSRIKERVEEKEGIPPVQQRLIFGGKQMSDDKMASDYNLEGGATLHLVLALRGGA